MSDTRRNPSVVCLNETVAPSLRQTGLDVFPRPGEALKVPIYDLHPVVYLHAPEWVVSDPAEGTGSEELDKTLLSTFLKMLEENGAPRIFDRPATFEPPRATKKAIVAGKVLGLVFAEKIIQDTRLLNLPWTLLRARSPVSRMQARRQRLPSEHELEDLILGSYRWGNERNDKLALKYLASPPTARYTAEIVENLLPSRGTDAGIPAESGPRLQFDVRGEPMAIRNEGCPGWAANLIAGGLGVYVVLKRFDAKKPFTQTLTEVVAEAYDVMPQAVTFTPLFVNGLGECLGCAVRIGKGAVLVLPEFNDKAAVVKRLATDLWQPIREWLAESAGAKAELDKIGQKESVVQPERTPKTKDKKTTPAAAHRRTRIPKDVEASILTKCLRRCCLCVILKNDWDTKKGQIAHLDDDPLNNAPDNLAWLCLEHHAESHSRSRQAKSFTPREIKSHRDRMLKEIDAKGLPTGT